jgi:hypothetical protein
MKPVQSMPARITPKRLFLLFVDIHSASMAQSWAVGGCLLRNNQTHS